MDENCQSLAHGQHSRDGVLVCIWSWIEAQTLYELAKKKSSSPNNGLACDLLFHVENRSDDLRLSTDNRNDYPVT